MKLVALMVRMPPDLRNWLAETAKEDERSMNWMIVSILKGAMGESSGAKEKTPIDAGKQ